MATWTGRQPRVGLMIGGTAASERGPLRRAQLVKPVGSGGQQTGGICSIGLTGCSADCGRVDGAIAVRSRVGSWAQPAAVVSSRRATRDLSVLGSVSWRQLGSSRKRVRGVCTQMAQSPQQFIGEHAPQQSTRHGANGSFTLLVQHHMPARSVPAGQRSVLQLQPLLAWVSLPARRSCGVPPRVSGRESDSVTTGGDCCCSMVSSTAGGARRKAAHCDADHAVPQAELPSALHDDQLPDRQLVARFLCPGCSPGQTMAPLCTCMPIPTPQRRQRAQLPSELASL